MLKESLSIIFVSFSFILAKEPELPLCPPNIQYFPQNLPMHCRMPSNSDVNSPFPPNFAPGKLPESMPGLPSSGAMPMPMPMPMPPIPSMPSMHPMPGQKLPVVVMPIYSPDTSHKKKRAKKHRRPRPIPEDSSDTDTSDDSSDTSDERGWWRRSNRVKNHNHRHPKRMNLRKRQELITPVLQYITKDGYVIYEKSISKGEATDWLHMRHDSQNEVKHAEELDRESSDVRDETNDNDIRINNAKTEVKQEKNRGKHQKKTAKNIAKNK